MTELQILVSTLTAVINLNLKRHCITYNYIFSNTFSSQKFFIVVIFEDSFSCSFCDFMTK